MIISDGALKFAKENGIEVVEEDTLVTVYERSQLERLMRVGDYGAASQNIFGDELSHDTIGAVAMDSKGCGEHKRSGQIFYANKNIFGVKNS